MHYLLMLMKILCSLSGLLALGNVCSYFYYFCIIIIIIIINVIVIIILTYKFNLNTDLGNGP